MVAQVHKQG